MPPHKALSWLQRAVEELQECRLSCAVRSHDGNARVAIDAKVQVLIEDPVFRVAERSVDHRDARRWQLSSRWEVQLQVRVIVIHAHRFLLQLGQHLHAALRLLRHLFVAAAEPRNELLQMRDLPLLLGGYGLGVRAVLGTHPEEGVVVAAIINKSFSVEEDRVRRALVEEGPVMRHNDHRLLPIPQELLEPGHSMHVQVVRRLVEQQQVRLHEKGLGQGDAHAPAAAELLRGPLLVLARETQACEDHCRARLRIIAAEVLQTLINLHEADAVDFGLFA
mmetsp:Transcript_1566/g.4302  ORF Transcript_1566/g.4302 Transcript_1566/m.4302 type:complete len:278 (+) Transcript_1566:655-1488(+)